MSEKSCDNCGHDDPLVACGWALYETCGIHHERWIPASGETPIDWSEVGPVLLEALEKAEALYLKGLLNATAEEITEVVELRRDAITKARGKS